MSRHGAGREQRDGGDGDAVRTIGTDAAVSKSSGGRGDGPFPACQLPLKSVCREKNCVASMRFGGFSGPSAPHGPSQDLSLSRHGRFGSPRTAPGAVGPALLPATLQPRSRLLPAAASACARPSRPPSRAVLSSSPVSASRIFGISAQQRLARVQSKLCVEVAAVAKRGAGVRAEPAPAPQPEGSQGLRSGRRTVVCESPLHARTLLGHQQHPVQRRL